MRDEEKAQILLAGLRQAVTEVASDAPGGALCQVECGNLSPGLARLVEDGLVQAMLNNPVKAEIMQQGVLRYLEGDGSVCIRMGWVKPAPWAI